MQNTRDGTVCILGLGYVGLTLATVMADVGFRIVGAEIREDIVKTLSDGKSHFHEPRLEQKLRRAIRRGQFSCADKIPKNCPASVYIITVGTPLDDKGRVRLDMIANASREVAAHLKKDDLVIVRSTVKLGTTRKIVGTILKETGIEFDLAFCPERTLEGQALEELRWLPQIIGGGSTSASIRAAQLFQHITPTSIRVSDIETAETIKLVDNAHRDVLFAYSNEVARICDATGVSAAEVIRSGALGYPRTDLPLPGLVGGPCLSKDSYILAEDLHHFDVEAELSLLARRINERQPEEIIENLSGLIETFRGFPERPRITLMGLAFKGRPETDDLRGSMAIPVLKALTRRFPNAEFRGFDAVIAGPFIRDMGLEPCRTMEEAMSGANLVLIINNHKIFSDFSIQESANTLGRPGLIYDFWNNFDSRDLELPEGTGYMALGSRGRAILPELKGA